MVHEPSDLTPLSEAEAADLAECEAVIAEGIETFYRTGAALATVRDTKLYRASHPTFEAYCRGRWSIGRQAAYQLISAAGVVENVRNCVQTIPANEAQARPLTALPPEQQVQVWEEVVKTAAPTGITAAHVTETRDRLIRRESPISLVPDAIIAPPAQTPQFITDILRSPEVRAATLREQFHGIMYELLSAVEKAQKFDFLRNVTPEEMAALLSDYDTQNERRVMPTLDWVRAVFDARRNAPAIRRIK